MTLKRWGIPSFTIDTDTVLLAAQAGEETVVFSLLLSNNEAANDAVFQIKHTDTDGVTVIFQWQITKAAGESPTAIDSPIVLAPGDKIIVQANQTNAAVIASGEAK